MKSIIFLPTLSLSLLFSCTTTKKSGVKDSNPNVVEKHTNLKLTSPPTNDGFIENILVGYPEYFSVILKNRREYNVQIIYTEINRDQSNRPVLKDHAFNLDANRYFYPASTVKLPAVVLALEKLNALNKAGLNRNTTMLTGTGFPGQTAIFNEPTAGDARPTIAQYIKNILMVSDNDAFNRIYEFLGPGYINDELRKKGFS